jgi:hypothetical protein
MFEFNIIENYGILSTKADKTGEEWAKEVNLVSWNRREPKLDIREWNSDHTKMNKGLTFTEEEAEILLAVLKERYQK